MVGVRFPEPGKEGHVPPRPGWKWGKGLVLWEERGCVPWKGQLSVHGHVPPWLQAYTTILPGRCLSNPPGTLTDQEC